MTTIFGLNNEQLNVSVIAADRQSTTSTASGIPVKKFFSRKLFVADNKEYCFGYVGLFDSEIEDFIGAFKENKFDVGKIVEKNFFEELQNLNIKKMGDGLPSNEKTFSFIMATRFEGKSKLYRLFPLGGVYERELSSVGSGQGVVHDYVEALDILARGRDYLNHIKVKTGDLITISLEALRLAQSKDVYSSGLDLLVCNSMGIDDHHHILSENFKYKLDKIKRQYK